MIAPVSPAARWLIWKLDRSQCEQPDWYEPTLGADFGMPMAEVRSKRVVRYVGPLTREMASNLFDAIEN